MSATHQVEYHDRKDLVDIVAALIPEDIAASPSFARISGESFRRSARIRFRKAGSLRNRIGYLEETLRLANIAFTPEVP